MSNVRVHMQRARKPLGNILDYGLHKCSQATVKRAYIKWRSQEILPTRCDIPSCHFFSNELRWNGKPISVILDHIDGNRKNNRPSNLRLLCPNCDSQLPTRGGGNKGRIQNATADSYQIVHRSGRRDVVVALRGVTATAIAGNMSVTATEP